MEASQLFGHDTSKCFKENLEEATQAAKERCSQFPSWHGVNYGKPAIVEADKDASEKGNEIVVYQGKETDIVNESQIVPFEVNSLALEMVNNPKVKSGEHTTPPRQVCSILSYSGCHKENMVSCRSPSTSPSTASLDGNLLKQKAKNSTSSSKK